MEIQAAVTRAPHAPMAIETLNLEEPRDAEILVRVVATGICHTDIVVRDRMLPTPQPVVLGHEGAGVVEKVGRAVSKVAPGDHVVMTFNSCGGCMSCLENERAYCHEFFPRNFFGQSSFATHALCHERNVVKVSKDARLELLGPLACGVQTGAGAIMNALCVPAGKSLAVFGTGSVGLSAILAARVVGATTVIAVDTNERRLAIARRFGATHVLNPANTQTTEEILRMTGGVNYALDTTGIGAVIGGAVASLAPRGVCGVLGASAAGSTITLDEVHFMSGGRRLIGIVEGSSNPDVFIPSLLQLHQQGRFPFDEMIELYPFERIAQAMEDSETGKTIKPVVVMS